MLPDFLPGYEFIVLDIVHNEIPQILLSTLDNQIKRIGNIMVFGIEQSVITSEDLFA